MGNATTEIHASSDNSTSSSNSTKKSYPLTPGQLRVIKRNGTIVSYDASKIRVAMTKAFLAVEGPHMQQSDLMHHVINALTESITNTFQRRWETGGTIHIEAIQDQVELALMRMDKNEKIPNAPAIARAYILYRDKRRQKREEKQKEAVASTPSLASILKVTLDNKTQIPLTDLKLKELTQAACTNLSDVNSEAILQNLEKDLFDGVNLQDVYHMLTMRARSLIETEPNYRYVAARLLQKQIRMEAFSFLDLTEDKNHFSQYFSHFLEKGIALRLLSPKLRCFDWSKLANAINFNYNNQFTYIGLRTLYDRYFIHHHNKRFELPQAFFMRVAMGLALEEPEEERNDRAIEFYQLLASFDYMSSTPTLFNSGTLRPQLSSCYISTFADDLAAIFKGITDNALLSKFAGGLGNSLTAVRAMGSHIQGTNGKSLGIIPFLKVINSAAVAVNQGGKRKGAACIYLENWHMDIEEFLDLRKNTGDERRRTHDINTAIWVSDLFMQRVLEDKSWTLFSPDETPDLHECYGKAFENAYTAYEAQAALGEINSKTISAKTLWRKMLTALFETGHPWITFKDACNLRSPQQHAGIIHSSNLCTEITLNTSQDEIAVCNLGSINLVNHLDSDASLNIEKLKKTIKIAIRMLDNVIDINYYPVPEAKNSNFRHRPIGMGLMGFQDALYKQSIPYDSQEAVDFADYSMEIISYYAIQASSELAKERGCYPSYQGSLWHQGILPIDSIAKLAESRSKHYLKMNTHQTLDWDSLRKQIKEMGMRNSNVMAIAPTATISNICGISQSIEPTYQNLFVKSNLSGEFTIINHYLVNMLKKNKLWDSVMINDLKYHDGSIQAIERIPDSIKKLFKGAFEIEPRFLVEAASRRQKWLDQAQSFNIYMAKPSGKRLHILYMMAWMLGLKTTYYLRSLGVSHAEKSTITDGALNSVKPNKPSYCAIDDPECEACQ